MRSTWSLALIGLALACGTVDPELEPPSDRTTYPTEGIGLKEGNVLAPHTFKAADGSEFSLDDAIFKDETNRVMVLVTAANWCAACKEEAKFLADLHAKYASKGLVIVSAIFENRADEPATLADVEWWRKTYKTPYHVVLDADPFQLGAYYEKAASPMNMVVDVDTMRITKIIQGSDPALVKALVEAKVGR
ncbi:MAG TPA: TlpA disulfide reductase family protein [Vulgatibacter sp.]|nr:TlpA disulfide reductase family protein [Vulgatibacter sp.]